MYNNNDIPFETFIMYVGYSCHIKFIMSTKMYPQKSNNLYDKNFLFSPGGGISTNFDRTTRARALATSASSAIRG